MNKEFSKHLKIVLTKMCNIVGAEYDNVDFMKNDWYWGYSWTQKQEDYYRKWLVKYLYNSKIARKEMMEYSGKDKKYIERFVNFFVMNYGWKISDVLQEI